MRDPVVLQPVPSIDARQRALVLPVRPAVERVVEGADSAATLGLEHSLSGSVEVGAHGHLERGVMRWFVRGVDWEEEGTIVSPL